MKRAGYLYNKLLDYNLLSEAFDAAARHKLNQKQVQRAVQQKDFLVRQLLYYLKTKTLPKIQYNIIYKYEPKQREIFVAPFFPYRILHHAIMKVLIPVLQPRFFEHSYSCIKNKGQHKAVTYNRKLIKKYKYCLKCDISKFYPSIPHDFLMRDLRRYIKDKDFLELLDEIILSAPESMWGKLCCDNFHNKLNKFIYKNILIPGDYKKNVPIGNYCSQWFGNLYLTELDRIISQGFHLKHVRYCDDFIIYSNDKQQLKDVLYKIEKYLCFRRKLVLSKANIFPTRLGVDFCGYRVFPNGKIKVRKSTKLRIKRKIKTLIYKLHHGYTTINQSLSIVGSYKGITKFSGSRNLDNKLYLNYLFYNLILYKESYRNYSDSRLRVVI